MQLGLALAESGVIVQLGAVIREEDDHRGVPQVLAIDLVQEPADVLVGERHLAQIARGVVVGELRGDALAGCAAHVGVQRGVENVVELLVLRPLPGVVVRRDVRDRRVEDLVRLKAVDPEKERRVGGVLVDPAGGGVEHAGREPVVFGRPIPDVVEVLQHLAFLVEVGRRVLRRARHVVAEVILEDLGDRVPGADLPAVAGLPTNVLERREAAGVVHVGLEHVRRVADQAGGVAAFDQALGHRQLLVGDLVPPVEPIPKRKPAHAGETAVPHLHRRTRLGEALGESNRLGGQLVERRSRHVAELLSRTDDIGAKRVEADDDDVQRVHAPACLPVETCRGRHRDYGPRGRGDSSGSATVRRVTRHRIPDSIGRNSEEVSGPTDLPQSESLGGK